MASRASSTATSTRRRTSSSAATRSIQKRTAPCRRACHQQPPAANAGELAKRAARAERQAVVATADEAVARAELELARAVAAQKPMAQQKLTAARNALAAACKAAETPGNAFTPLRG